MRQLGLLAKFWEPGRVKTRLAERIGPQRAAEVHRLFLTTLVRRLTGRADRLVLSYTPLYRREALAQLAGEGWCLEPQADGDLGRRLRAYFAAGRAQGAERIVALGADSPQVPLAWIDDALELLGETSVVLGPADDGGYWLVGVRGDTANEVLAALLDDIPWSTADVWATTLDRLQQVGIEPRQVPGAYDVDRPDDLQRLRAELARPPIARHELGPSELPQTGLPQTDLQQTDLLQSESPRPECVRPAPVRAGDEVHLDALRDELDRLLGPL